MFGMDWLSFIFAAFVSDMSVSFWQRRGTNIKVHLTIDLKYTVLQQCNAVGLLWEYQWLF